MNIFYLLSLCFVTFNINLNSQNTSFRIGLSLSYLKYYREKNPSFCFYYFPKTVCCACRILWIDVHCVSESCFPRCQRLPVCVWLHLLQWHQPDGQVCLAGERLAGLVSRDKLPGKPHQCRETSSPGLPDWLLTVKSGLHGRDLAVPRNFTVELLLLSQLLGLAASQLLMSPKHTINVEFLFYPFLEESKNKLSSLELSRMNHLMP